MENKKQKITEDTVREIVTQYNKRKGQYRMNSLMMLTVDEIIEQITIDLNDNNKR